MPTHTKIKPLQRKALLTMASIPSHELIRTCDGFVPPTQGDHPVFTTRLMRMMDRDYLITFDDPDFPRRAALTPRGLQLASEMQIDLRKTEAP